MGRGEVKTKYGCPSCNQTKTDETRNYLKDNVTEIIVHYGDCYIRYHRTGAVWRKQGELCVKEMEHYRKMKEKQRGIGK